MKRRSVFILLLTLLMTGSAVGVGELVLPQSTMTVYAASLSAPKVKAAASSYKSIKLSWKKVKGAKQYIILRSTKKKSGYKKLKTTTKTAYTDSKASCGKTYYYKVIAVKGGTKKTSKVVKIKCTPAKVTSLKAASDTCGTVKLTYKKVKGASGYAIAYSAAKSGTYTTVATTKATSYAHTLGAGSTGYYKVRAYRTVKGKKIYGAYSSVKAATAAAHTYQTQTTAATCTAGGFTTYTCALCGNSYTADATAALGHDYGSYTVQTAATCAAAGTKYTTCSRCGDRQYATIEPTNEHRYTTVSTATCTQAGEAQTYCTVCGKVADVQPADAIGHTYTYTFAERFDEVSQSTKYYAVCRCSVCGEAFETDTLRLDLTDIKTKDLSNLAGIAELSASGNKLTLTATKYIDTFELTGTVKDITVSVDALADADIRLCGLTITNSDTTKIDDCIRINDKCTEMKQSKDDAGNLLTNADGTPVMEKVVPTVSVTAQRDTENSLLVTASGGNAIQCEPKLELKGNGKLTMQTVSTAVDARAKVDIKNLTLDITSGNRGIDTKLEIKNAQTGLVEDTEFSNIDFGANATVTINTEDDGIRCKNMEFEAIDTAAGEVGSVLTITSKSGDALQLEGKKGLTMYQGTVTLSGGKLALNDKSGTEPAVYPGASLIR